MVTGRNSVRCYRTIFLLLLAFSFFFRLWFITSLPLSGDESYHWEWSRNPAWGYYDHPGLTAYLIRLSTLVFGASTEFTVRLPALLMLTGTALVCYFFARRIVREHGGDDIRAERAGAAAGSLVVLAPVFALFSVYISTDPPVIFFWALGSYLLYLAFKRGGWALWMGAGLAFGFLVLSKFLGLLLVGASGVFILVSREDRRWLRRPHAYVAALCGLAVLGPFLWWNVNHEWATFMFNFVYRQKSGGWSLAHVGEFVLGQTLALSPLIFICALRGVFHAFSRWVSAKERDSLFLGLTSAVPMLYFLYVSFRREVGLHWPAAGWVGAIVYLCSWWEKAPQTGRGRTVIKATAFGLCVAMTAGMHLLAHVPPRWIRIDWKYSDISVSKHYERFGWRELGNRVSEVRTEMVSAQQDGGGERGVFVISDQYGMASNVAFYTPEQLRTHLWSRRRTHGENYRFWDDFEVLAGQDALFVVKDKKRADKALAKLAEHFEEVDEPEPFPIMVDGEEVRRFFLVRCRFFNGVEPTFAEDKS